MYTCMYLASSTTITFQPNEASVVINIQIYDDSTPETDERFYVSLSNPVGGAVLGDQVTVPVTILTNDEAHGMVGFTEVRFNSIDSPIKSLI